MTQKNQKSPIRWMFVALILLGTGFVFAQQAPSLTTSNTKEEIWDFSIRVMTQTFATETVFFSQTDGITTFSATTALHSQGQEALFKTRGMTDDSRITAYYLEADYNRKHSEISAVVKGDTLEVKTGNTVVTVPWTPNTILLDNNLSFMYDLVGQQFVLYVAVLLVLLPLCRDGRFYSGHPAAYFIARPNRLSFNDTKAGRMRRKGYVELQIGQLDGRYQRG